MCLMFFLHHARAHAFPTVGVCIAHAAAVDDVVGMRRLKCNVVVL